MHIPFLFLFDFFKKRKILFGGFITIIICLSSLGLSKIRFEENIQNLIPNEKSFVHANQLFKQNRISDRIVILLQSKQVSTDYTTLSSKADSLAQSLNESDSIFSEVLYKAEPFIGDSLYSLFYRNMPLYMTDDDYQFLKNQLDSIESTLASNYKLTFLPVSSIFTSRLFEDPFHIVPKQLQRFRNSSVESGISVVDDYLTPDAGQSIVLFAYPNKSFLKGNVNEKCLKKLMDIKSKYEASGFNLYFFGTPLVEAANAKVIKRDIILTSSLALLALLIFISSYFKSPIYFFRIILPVLLGGFLSLGCIGFLQGHISSLSLGLGAVLLGLGVNISLHFYTHYINHPDARQLLRELSSASIITALTTSTAFFCLCFLSSPVLHDIGLFSGLSILFITLSNLIIVPQFLKNRHNAKVHSHFIDRLARYPFHKNKILLASLGILLIASLYYFQKVQFEADMNKMSYVPEYLKQSEDILEEKMQFKLKNVFAITEASTMDELSIKAEENANVFRKLRNDRVIESAQDGLFLILSLERQKVQMERWRSFWNNDRVLKLKNSLSKHASLKGYNPKAYSRYEQLISLSDLSLSDDDKSFVLNHFSKDQILHSDSIVSSVVVLKVKESNRKLLYEKLKGYSQIHLFDKRMLTDSLVELVKSDLNFLLLVSFGLVALLILISFGRIELTLLSILPMMIGWIITLGLMAFFKIPFTIFNIILATFIFGMGDDFSVFLISGLQAKYATGVDQLTSYRSSVILACITTICGMGVLTFASHPALQSIGMLAVIGIFSVVLSSFVIQPILFDFFISNRKESRKVPITFFGFLISLIAFSYFFIGCILLSILGVILILLIPHKRTKLIFHYCIHLYCKSLNFLMFIVKENWVFDDYEDFGEPAVIIANHSSFVDILVILAMHPKVIMLANDWVFNKSVYALLVRLAGFYHVENGYESAIPHLKVFIDQGYSVMVFPEGTRSIDGNIKRFHKGAFYIAEKLNLDIVPIFIHGLHLAMPKGDFLLKPSTCTIRIAKRIKHDDLSFGSTYSEKALGISRWMKAEYIKMRSSFETPNYYASLVIQNYILKGPVLEWYVRIKLRMESNYSIYHKLIPKKSVVTDIGCGYGYMSFILALADDSIKVNAFDFDQDKISITQNLSCLPTNLKFECADMLTYNYTVSDVFIFGDVLHYVSQIDQERLLSRIVEVSHSGTLILIRESDSDKSTNKHKKALKTEVASTAIGFNKFQFEDMSFISGNSLKIFFESRGFSFKEVEERQKNSNTLFMATKL